MRQGALARQGQTNLYQLFLQATKKAKSKLAGTL
jgi:hypothetical protein